MATKSLIINSTSTAGKKLQKTMTNINPNCSNEDAGTFAQMTNALTTNTYGSAAVVKKMDVTEEDSGGGSTPTVTLNVTEHISDDIPLDFTYETIEGGIRVRNIYNTETYINVTYTVD